MNRYPFIQIISALTILFTHNMLYSQCYELVWAEEFNYTGYPDAATWTPEEGGEGWGNNESQYYTVNDSDNAYVEDGVLTITALEENTGTNLYTSARLITKDKFEVQYGKIEASIKLPFGQGLWPAFWMLGENISEVGWPACGEIDIMEMVGGTDGDNTIHGTIHWDNNGSHAQYGRGYSLEESIFADTFHTFSIEWTPDQILWKMDGIQYNIVDITPAELSEFRNEFFIILNLAVGGNWPGYPDASTTFPQTMQVDYVRVYKKSDEVEQFSIEGNDIVPASGTGLSYSLPSSPDWQYEWTLPGSAGIISGQGTNNVMVNWGCEDGIISASVTGICQSYSFQKEITTEEHINGPVFIRENEEQVTFSLAPMAHTTYSWNFPGDVSILSGENSDTVIVNWGTTFDPVSVDLSNQCGDTNLQFETIIYGKYPFPDINTPHPIPGTIDAVNFDYGGEDISYYDTSSGNEGGGLRDTTNVDTEYNDNGNPNVGWISNGEWLEYTVKVQEEGWYDVEMRVATQNATGGPFSLLFNDDVKLDEITVSSTGGWANFRKISAGTIFLTEADTLMRILFNTGGFNLSTVTFSPGTEPSAASNDLIKEIRIFPSLTKNYMNVKGLTGNETIAIYTLIGQRVKEVRVPAATDVRLDLSAITNGAYIIRVYEPSGKTYQNKFIKQ